jgi:hypothetical protein
MWRTFSGWSPERMCSEIPLRSRLRSVSAAPGRRDSRNRNIARSSPFSRNSLPEVSAANAPPPSPVQPALPSDQPPLRVTPSPGNSRFRHRHSPPAISGPACPAPPAASAKPDAATPRHARQRQRRAIVQRHDCLRVFQNRPLQGQRARFIENHPPHAPQPWPQCGGPHENPEPLHRRGRHVVRQRNRHAQRTRTRHHEHRNHRLHSRQPFAAPAPERERHDTERQHDPR